MYGYIVYIAIAVVVAVVACGVFIVLASKQKKEGYTTTKNAIARFYTSDLKSGIDIGPGMENGKIHVANLKERLQNKGGLKVEYYGKYRGTGYFKYATGQPGEPVNLKDRRLSKDQKIFNIPSNIEIVVVHK